MQMQMQIQIQMQTQVEIQKLKKAAQCIVWNTWGPIESGAKFAFGWSKSVVQSSR